MTPDLVSCARGAIALAAMCGVLTGGIASMALASDHIDGEMTKEEPLADLSDFYAFPSDGGAKLSLILNTYPIASSGAQFSSGISYAFEIRAASVQESSFALGEGMRIECGFADERGNALSVTCSSDRGLTATAERGDVSGSGPLRVFYDRRSDPFFFSADWATATSLEGEIAESDGKNTMSSLNVLSLALQIDRTAVPGGGGLVALAVEAFTEDGGTRRYLDRVGRPEITNVTLIHRGDGEDIRDAVNHEPAFDMSDAAVAKMEARLSEAIRYYDDLDGQQDWSADMAWRLITVLKQDVLVLDLDQPCDQPGFFEIERAMLDGQPHTSCGGRKVTDDIIDTLYSLYITRNREVVGDGVDAPDLPVSDDFPHLAPPVSGFGSWLKTSLGDWRAR